MEKYILTINSGSSSLKFGIFNKDLTLLLKGGFERIGLADTKFSSSFDDKYILGDFKNHEDCLIYLFNYLSNKNISIYGVGHRVVHGGDYFNESALISTHTLNQIKSLTLLAPLHQPHNIKGIEIILQKYGIPQIAVFDTAFHQTIPIQNNIFPIPYHFYEDKIKAYGFHGLSYEYISTQPILSKYENIVVAHLGNGSSACALKNHKSFSSTMGFTALDGLMMGTRPGSIDPGLVLHLLDSGMTTKELSDLFYKKSGLLGLSEYSSDVRDLTNAYLDTNHIHHNKSKLSLDLYADKAAEKILKLISSLRKIDALVFTAGIGENSAFLRKLICERLEFCNIKLNLEINESSIINQNISHSFNNIPIFIIPTNEEFVIAQAVQKKI